ncbi:DHA2 family efflux MFS transporter permease subunit [Amycolatopsis sp. NPDC005961]|uniref:DHA2 family efflux MFS transporter permease subunit n=1 Tax=Amycolatopsis sp. NPDC005961 TaxID=3156720 RepID=UPI0033C19E50
MLTLTCVGQFMVLLDNTIVGVALPDMQTNLHTTLTGLQWIVDAYVLAVAMLLLAGGVSADKFGRKRVFLGGLAVFTVASLLCSFAPDVGWLLAGRVLQGIGAAVLSPASLALLASAYPVPQERIKAIGLWAGLSGIGMAAGPATGGILTSAFGWPAIFLVNVPIGVVALIVGVRVLAESKNPAARAFDLPGQVLSILAVGALTFGLIEAGDLGWTSPLILSFFAAAVVLFIAFLVVEARSAAPMLPLHLFRQKLFSVSNTAMTIVGFALMGSAFFFSQFFVFVQGYSLLSAGVATLPSSLAMVICSPYAGRIAARFGFRSVVTTGLVLAGAGLILMAGVHQETPYLNVWWRLTIIGIGFGLTMSPLTGAAISSVPPQEGGLASGISSVTRQIGAVFGVAVLGAIVTTQQTHGGTFASGLNAAFLTAGVVTLVTAVLTGLWLVRSKPAAPAPAQAPAQQTAAPSPAGS